MAISAKVVSRLGIPIAIAGYVVHVTPWEGEPCVHVAAHVTRKEPRVDMRHRALIVKAIASLVGAIAIIMMGEKILGVLASCMGDGERCG